MKQAIYNAFTSIFLTKITTMHYIANFFQKSNIKDNSILFIEYENANIIKNLESILKPLIITTHNKFDKKSFFRRRIKNLRIPINRIIKKPFIGIYFSENKLKKAVTNFYQKNYSIFLQKQHFEKIVLYDEYSLPNYSLMCLTKKIKNITTFGLQHGMISIDHHGYIFQKNSTREKNLPDYFITYGQYEKNLLTKKSIWNPKKVYALGCPRYDYLTNKKININEFKDKHIIPKNKKLLFWPTQTHETKMQQTGEHDLNAKTIIKELSKNPDWFLLIKLHPDENTATSKKLYEQYAKKYQLNNILILKHNEANTHDCILASNAVLNKHSTTGMEAIMLKTPVISLELMQSWDISDYKELKSKLIIKRMGDLENYLKTIQTKEFQNLFKEERQKYLKKHFNNFGTATKKIIEFIKEK